MRVRQMPVNTLQAGLYQWVMVTEELSRMGHVVLRGPEAKPIGEFDYPQGSETWYWEAQTGEGGEPSFTLKLLLECDPEDPKLIDAVAKVRDSEKDAGTTSMVPDWQDGAPLPSSGDIVTLTDVADGPGKYDQLYQRVSFFMPIDGDPVLPTWYTDIPGLYSVFGGDPDKGAPIQQGITATMSWVKQGDPGYPAPDKWLWFGRDPE